MFNIVRAIWWNIYLGRRHRVTTAHSTHRELFHLFRWFERVLRCEGESAVRKAKQRNPKKKKHKANDQNLGQIVSQICISHAARWRHSENTRVMTVGTIFWGGRWRLGCRTINYNLLLDWTGKGIGITSDGAISGLRAPFVLAANTQTEVTGV